MADRITARSPMVEIEMKLGIEPLDDLLHNRSNLVERVADLRARFGAWGTFDHIRKMELARLSGLLRAQALRDKVKVTESQLDQDAHAHPDYRDLITTATKERAEWCKLEAQIENIDFTIQRGQAVARFVSAEARL